MNLTDPVLDGIILDVFQPGYDVFEGYGSSLYEPKFWLGLDSAIRWQAALKKSNEIADLIFEFTSITCQIRLICSGCSSAPWGYRGFLV